MSHWRDKSEAVIGAALDALPAGADKAAIEKAVSAAYPFHQRAMHPYKIYLDAKKKILQKRYPKFYAKPEPTGPSLSGAP